jgi:hypothetical protein
MICDRCKQKTFVIYILQPDYEKVCSRECKGKNNKYPVLYDNFKSKKEVVCQLFEETIQTVSNGGLSSRCTRPELAARDINLKKKLRRPISAGELNR